MGRLTERLRLERIEVSDGGSLFELHREPTNQELLDAERDESL